MRKNTIIIVAVAIIIIILLGIWAKKGNDAISIPAENGMGTQNNSTNTTSSSSVNSETESAIRAKIIEFGQKLKLVSPLAADFKNQVQVQYNAYVTPDLLAKWKADPSLALGRTTSTPSPDRIEIVSVTKQDANTYKVEGNVIEVGADSPKTLAVYPVTLTVNNDRNVWLVTTATKGAYSKPPQAINLNGTLECLPHKNMSGPQTMECAYGIKADTSGKHYAVDFSSLPGGMATTIPTNSHVHVEGTLVPENQLNSSAWEKYPIEGIIAATILQKI